MNLEEHEQEQELKLSKINTAGLQNFRRDDLWKDAHNHSRKGFYMQWNEDLDAMWRELISGATPEDITKFNEINEELSTILTPIKNQNGFKSISHEEYMKKIKIKNSLVKKENFLRILEDKQGKGSAYKEGADEYMQG